MRGCIGLLVFGFVITGCVGEITGTGGGTEGDPNPGTDAGASAADAPGQDAPGQAFACRQRITAGLISGEHHPGEDCKGACHNHGFTLAGTVFSSTAGTAPFTGGTVTVIDANNVTVDLVTAQNGNFYTRQGLTFPVKVVASSCPDVAPMTTQVVAASAGCNQGGCHTAGATGPIHLP